MIIFLIVLTGNLFFSFRGWNVPLWKKLFHSCLNIPGCDQIPDISEIRREFEEYFVNNLLDKYNTTQSALFFQFIK